MESLSGGSTEHDGLGTNAPGPADTNDARQRTFEPIAKPNKSIDEIDAHESHETELIGKDQTRNVRGAQHDT